MTDEPAPREQLPWTPGGVIGEIPMTGPPVLGAPTDTPTSCTDPAA